MTVIKNLACPTCGLPGEPSSALGVCLGCLPNGLTGAGTAVDAERPATPPVGATGAQTSALTSTELAVDGREERTWVMDQLVSQLLRWAADLELQVEDFRDQLGEAGYLQLVDNDSDALYLALADAQETQRARDVIAAHEHLLDDEGDVALILEQAIAVVAEHERVRGQLYEHEWIDGDRSLPEVIDDVLAFTAEAERASGLLLDHDLLPLAMDLPGAVRSLVAERAQVRAELSEAGYSCWAQPTAEVVQELIAAAAKADALEQQYLREHRRSQRIAAIARRALVSAHAAAHSGTTDGCPQCAADWVQITACDQIAI